MNKRLASVAAAVLLSAPLFAHADIFQFNAALNSANENRIPPVIAPGTGVATLHYDTMSTASFADDTFDFSMSVFGLTGGTTPGTAASAFHIHGAATTAENAPVRVSLDAPPFVFLNSGSTLLVGGSNVAAPTIPPTPFVAPGGASNPNGNVGYPAMSFLTMLQAGLAYVNVHTALNPGGEVRGQLFQVAAIPTTPIPEPSTYALMLAGLAIVGWATRRRKANTMH